MEMTDKDWDDLLSEIHANGSIYPAKDDLDRANQKGWNGGIFKAADIVKRWRSGDALYYRQNHPELEETNRE